MTYEERTVELSKDNYHAAIETFLRSMKEIHNDEDVILTVVPRNGNNIMIKITPKQEEKENQTTVH